MVATLAKPQCKPERDVELKRQKAIVQLLRASALPAADIRDKVWEFLQSKVLTTDVCAEVKALYLEKGLGRSGEARGAPLSEEEALPLTTSRFDQEFERLELLGRGGFGEVWRVRSRVDRKEYAVKMVSYQYSEQTGPFEHSALREARHWASVTEPGAVRYHASWLELESPEVQEPMAKALTAPCSDAEDSSNPVTARSEWTYNGVGEATASAVVFERSTTAEPESEEQEGCWQVSPRRRSAPAAFPNKLKRATLFLQTELIRGGTLRQWLDRRNQALAGSGPVPPELGAQAAEDIFRQCVDAIARLHAQGIVHRDIKPGNILLTEEGNVRLADFGLATKDARAWLESESASTMTHDWSDAIGQDGDHTSGVGTKVYASPEQMDGSQYDHKVDIYALGMILGELLYPVETHMERAQLFEHLRMGLLPSDMRAIRPEASELLLSMLSSDPSSRPSAGALLEMLRQHAGDGGEAMCARPSQPVAEGRGAWKEAETSQGEDTTCREESSVSSLVPTRSCREVIVAA